MKQAFLCFSMGIAGVFVGNILLNSDEFTARLLLSKVAHPG